MTSTKILALAAVAVIFLIFLIVACRIIYLLATRHSLDFASLEIKSYMCGFLVTILITIILISATGVAPVRHGQIDSGSNPLGFTFATAKYVVAFLLCGYALYKAFRLKSWVLRIKK